MNGIALIRYDNAKKAIAEYKTVDEVKDFRDKAMAIEAYARQAKDYDLEHDASIARVRAERKCGEMLAEMEKAKGGEQYHRSSEATSAEPVKTLSEMGITKDQSSKWQALAKVDEKVFEEAVSAPAKTDDGKRNPISTKKIINPDYPVSPKPKMNEHALWWWGTLIRLEKDSRFSLSVEELLSEMTDAMRSDSEIMFNKLRDYLNE